MRHTKEIEQYLQVVKVEGPDSLVCEVPLSLGAPAPT